MLMAQHQDLGVLPPRLPPGQAQHRHDAGDNEEDQLQAHKPKIIARPPARKPTNRHARALTLRPPRRIRPGSMRFRHPHVSLAATAHPGRIAENAAAGSPPWFGPGERAYIQRLATAH